MDLDAFKPAPGVRKQKKRVGRGNGSGWGGTAGRGHKGQKARSGGTVKRGFEGGQMSLARRIPKWGFNNIFKKEYEVCNIDQLNVFKKGETVDRESLSSKGLIDKKKGPFKVLGNGELKVALTVKANKFSRTAREKIEAAGGQIEVLS
jgi:large subunit ribosomal protein L15